MYDSASISVLLKLAVLFVVAIPTLWRMRWPEIPLEAGAAFTFLAFFAGSLCTSVYFLVRYKHELTPAKGAQE